MAAGRLIARYRLTPWWARVLVVFALSRVVTTTILLAYAAAQGPNAWTGAHPSYLDYARIWDGNWYWIIAVSGYPDELPVTPDGQLAENAWAFLPVFPMLARGLTAVTTLPFAAVAVVISVAAAAGTALIFHRILVRVLPEGSALFAVALFCFAPLSPILQVAYAESLHLLLLALGLLLLLQRRYWMLLPVVIVMSLTRPSGLAFALALLLHAIHRFVRRRERAFPLRDRIAVIAVGLVSAASGLAWPAIAGAVTGRLDAYTGTELAWRSAYIGPQPLIPFAPWIQGLEWWAGLLGIGEPLALVVAVLAVVLLVVVTALVLVSPAARRLGPDLRFWSLSYALYLVAVWFPQSSTFRLLMPLFPLLGAAAVPTSRLYRAGLLAGGILLQIGWVHVAWWVNGADWTPP